ncbi:MAG: ATP-binding protein [Pseudomonadota bacterium]
MRKRLDSLRLCPLNLSPMRMRPILLSVLATAALAFAAFQVAYRYFDSEERAAAAGRLSLYQSTVTAELGRFQHLTYVLSLDPFVIAAAEGQSPAQLNARFEDFAAQAGIDAIYLMTPDGLTIAASNHARPGSFLGQNYGFRPYFRDALNAQQGRYYAIGATTGLPGYFIADPVRTPEGAIAGVIALKIDLSGLEDSWRGSGEQVFLANGDGVVMLASNPDWTYQSLTRLTDAQRNRIEADRQFTGQPLSRLDWTPLSDDRARIGGVDRLHLTTPLGQHDWVLHYFAPTDPILTRSWLAAAFVVVLAGLGLIGWQIQRNRQVGAALARSEREEAELRQANTRLAQEIEDRRTAERRLKRTQGELQRASRLAALGQLAASVTHELGQPIAAMKNHLTAAELNAANAPDLTGRIGGLVQRMEDTTRQLKFFARSDAETFEDVDLTAAMQTALTLVEPNRQASGAIIKTSFPERPVHLRGSRLRLEQVMTNLLRNALDASEDSTPPTLEVRVGGGEASCWFSVRDNGHGLGAASLAELQEPFVTTRESGRGMGLGLAIASGIVQDHGGEMSAENLPEGGACFTVRLPLAQLDAAAAE